MIAGGTNGQSSAILSPDSRESQTRRLRRSHPDETAMRPLNHLLRAFVLVLSAAALIGCTTTGGSNPNAGSTAETPTAPAAPLVSLAETALDDELNDADRRVLAEAEFKALETAGPNRPVSWRNERSGHFGQVSAGPAYFVNERNCRDVVHTITVDGTPTIVRATACRLVPEGQWRNVT